MHSELFSIGPFVVHSYGLMIAIGTILAFYTAMYRAKRIGLDSEFVFDVGLYSGIAGIICTRLLYYIVELPNIIKDPSILWNFQYGYVVFGGIIGGVLMGLFYCKKKKKNFLDYFDLIMPSIVLAQAFGRIGCFLAGCCYGKETDSVFGVVFHNSQMAPNGVKLIPTQLISSGGDFLIYFILILYAKRSKKRGRVGAMYLILYSVGRFFVEFLRDDYRGSIGFLSTSQLISIGTVIVGIILFFLARPKKAVIAEENSEENVVENALEEEQQEDTVKAEGEEDEEYEIVYMNEDVDQKD